MSRYKNIFLFLFGRDAVIKFTASQIFLATTLLFFSLYFDRQYSKQSTIHYPFFVFSNCFLAIIINSVKIILQEGIYQHHYQKIRNFNTNK